jgi:Rho-binding antiterminator
MVANDEYTPINCDDYDYLELACQHHWKLEIKVKGGEIINGTAKDLQLKRESNT